MLFNSVAFMVFFPVVTLGYFLLPHKYRWFWLLASSIFFYMYYIPVYITILAVTILIDYFAGMYIERSEGRRKKQLLFISILSTCLVLFIFKYFNFFNTNMQALAEFLHWNYPLVVLQLALPIGLSFHTFQSLSYVIEVYRGHQKAETNFGIYSLYVMFYPQLVAGPIERPQNLLQQFYEKHYFEYERVTNGLKLMAWGMFKKVVIADRLAVVVNGIYNQPHSYTGLYLIIATVFFAFQIFCDFSGYSDIARGAAQVMGFNLMVNFDRPYMSRSISEFWRRWHISLSTWFRDYMYIPLGGNRVSRWRWRLNIMLVFLVSGVWHGANWTFIVWGALHGLSNVLSNMLRPLRAWFIEHLRLERVPRLLRVMQVSFTFCLVTIIWIFFRANNISDAWYIVSHLHTGLLWDMSVLYHAALNGGLMAEVNNLLAPITMIQSKFQLMVGIGFIAVMEIVHILGQKKDMLLRLADSPWVVRWTAYYALVMSILLFGFFSNQQFIYFQF